MWDKELPEIKKWQDVEEDYVPLSSIPEDIQKEVVAKLSEMADQSKRYQA